MQQPTSGRTFGSLLRWYRINAGLTQEQLAERAGLSRRGIADLERGARRAPYAHTIQCLATALGLSEADHGSFLEAAHHQAARRTAPTQSDGRPDQGRLGASTDAVGDGAGPHQHDNLPSRPNSFVGRQTDRARLRALLGSTARLVTLLGTGGVGKTRLALEVASAQVGRWRDGVWLVELAAVTDAKLVVASVADVVGVQQQPGRDLMADLVAWLRDKQLLLVLDNCEHVVEVCAHLAGQLVQACPDLRLLATSREVLAVDGETIWRVEPLAMPDGVPHSAERALESEAVRLFVDRAAAAAPGFCLTDQNAAAVARICERLDGLPLALELTAASLRALAIDDAARRLDQRFTLLTSGNRTALPRHRTLRALVDWSYDLLDDHERGLFEQLSVFSGGWTLDGVEAICAVAEGTTLERLRQLIGKSLVHTEPQPDGSVRYAMLETLREYAAERLRVRRHALEVQRRHALFYGDALTRWWGPAWWNAQAPARLARIAADYANLRASFRWLVEHGEVATAQRLAGSLTFFWLLRGRIDEGRQWLEEALALSDSASDGAARSAAIVGLAQLQTEGGNRTAALTALESALPTIRDSADAPTLAQALMGVGWLTWVTRYDRAPARTYLEEGLHVAETARIGALQALGRTRLAVLAQASGDDAEAERLLEANRVFSLNGGEPLLGRGGELLLVGMRLMRGQYVGGSAYIEGLLGQHRTNRHPFEVMTGWILLSWARLAEEDVEGAGKAAVQAVTIVQQNLGSYFAPGHLGAPLEQLAVVAATAGDHACALRLEAAATTLREHDAILRLPRGQARLDRALAPSRRMLGRRGSAAAAAAGRALGVEAAIAEALAFTPPRASDAAT